MFELDLNHMISNCARQRFKPLDAMFGFDSGEYLHKFKIFKCVNNEYRRFCGEVKITLQK